LEEFLNEKLRKREKGSQGKILSNCRLVPEATNEHGGENGKITLGKGEKERRGPESAHQGRGTSAKLFMWLNGKGGIIIRLESYLVA